MSPLKISLVAALAAVLMTSAGWSHVQQGRSQEAARLRSENNQLRLKVSQQHRMQLGQDALSAQKARLTPPLSGSPGKVALVDHAGERTTEVSPVLGTEYRNEGQATPVAALQTFAWACDHADAALMEKLIVFDADAREKTAAHFASLSPEERPESVSFEAAAAALYISDGMKHPYPVAAILELANFEVIQPGRVRLHLPDANGDGYEFQQTPDGWKLAVTIAVVDDYIKESAGLATRR